jgi:tyrosyl-tRNA synthetase
MLRDKEEKINEVLNRGVEMVYPTKDAFAERLRSGKKVRLYLGIDPTGKLHVGHGVQLLKLRQLQDLGHDVIVLYGGFTAMVGDPTDKTATRQPLTAAQIKKNAVSYKKLIGKILDLKKANVRFLNNEQWSNKLKPVDMLNLASQFTVARLLERDMFQKRLQEGKEIHLHEFLYPMFQAYDAVTMDVDLQIGGNDQTFNMLAGRTLMRKLKDKECFVLSTKLLVDPTGKKMGKTEGNMVNMDDEPNDIYGKVMSWPDTIIPIAFEIVTAVPYAEVLQIQKEFAAGAHPKPLKMKLAWSIVELYHGAKAAAAAEDQFKQVHESGMNPDDMPTVKVSARGIIDVLVETKLVASKSEARRVIAEGGIRVNDERVTDEAFIIPSAGKEGSVLQKGKRHFVRVV